MLRYLIIFVYIAVNILLLVLNWDLFTGSNNLNFGFGVYYASPYVLLQVLGLIALVAFAGYDGIKDLTREVYVSKLEKKILELKKDSEINSIKDKVRNTQTTTIEAQPSEDRPPSKA